MEFLSTLSIPELLLVQWLNTFLRYSLIAGVTYFIFWEWGFNKFRHRFLYKQKPAWSERLREIKYSLMTTLIFVAPVSLLVIFKPFEASQIYFKVAEKGIPWYLLSYAVVFFLHDTYFYWTHRLMHTQLFYGKVHKVHHLSLEPSPLAAFAFHPWEALAESFLFLILPFVMPLHWTVLLFFTLFSLFMNVYGHLGFNLFSDKTRNSFPLNLWNHSAHHSWHHRNFKGNYGFYLKFWDQVMGTHRGELRPYTDQ